MELILVISSQIFATLFGGSILILFSYNRDTRKISIMEKIMLSYAIGMGAIPIYMLLLYLAGLAFTPFTIYLPLFACMVPIYTYRLLRDTGKERLSFSGIKFSKLNILFLIGILFEVFHSFFRALIRPIESFDSVASFAIKAKVFFLAKGIPQDFFQNLAGHFPHPRYPLMVPLQETFCFLSMGSFNDLLVKALFPLHFLALIVLFYFSIKEIINRNIAFVFTFLLCSLNELNRFSATGFTDIHFSLYFSLAGFLKI